jgi:5-methylcytosine-specific restriction protein A
MPTIKLLKDVEPPRMTDVERHKSYNKRTWVKLRKAHLVQHPLCADCEKRNKIVAAEEVHHLDSPFQYEEPKRTWRLLDPTNLISLCKRCHSRRHLHPNL